MATTNAVLNVTADASPSFAARYLILGDSIAKDFRNGAGAGALLDQIGAVAGLAGEAMLVNAAWGGFRLMGESGDDRFLNFSDLADAPAMTDAIAIMDTAGPVDGAVIIIGTNDLGQVLPAPGAIAGYDAAKIAAGLAQLAARIRAENVANGHAGGTLPVILCVPGRDGATANKTGAGRVWRRAAVTAAAADPDLHLLDYWDLDLEDGVHPSLAGYHALGWRLGRMLAKHVHAAGAVGGPPSIGSIVRTDATTLRIGFTVPSGESLRRVTVPSAWRVEDMGDGDAPLQIARLDWVDALTADLILQDAAAGEMRLMAPYDLVQDFTAEGAIRTTEDDDNQPPGFALQSFEGETG